MAAVHQVKLLHLKYTCFILGWYWLYWNVPNEEDMLDFENQESRSLMLMNIGTLKNFANFTGRYLYWSLFFNKATGLQLY